MKRILIVYAKDTLELLNRKSALGSYIFCLCEILQKNEFKVFVNGLEFDHLSGMVYTENKKRELSKISLGKLAPKFLKDFLKDILVFKRMRRLSSFINSQANYDCVLEFNHYGSNIGYVISKSQNIPMAFVFDGPIIEDFEFFQGRKYFFKKKISDLERGNLLFARQIVVYSNAVKAYLTNSLKRDLNISIHQNVDFSRLDFLDKNLNVNCVKIGFIGSFLKWHRIDLLINAFIRLKDSGLSVELYLIGAGMEFQSISDLVSNTKYKNFIKMAGFLDGTELTKFKKELHIGVMPGSNWYGAPNKIFEYGAANMAVVAPKTPTIVDLFENERDLLLFEQDNEDELYNNLKLLCEDSFLRERFAHTLQEKIREKYSERNTADFYCDLLIKTMGN